MKYYQKLNMTFGEFLEGIEGASTPKAWVASRNGARVEWTGYVSRVNKSPMGVLIRILASPDAAETLAVSCYPNADTHVKFGDRKERRRWLRLKPGQEIPVTGIIEYDADVNRLFRLKGVILNTSVNEVQRPWWKFW